MGVDFGMKFKIDIQIDNLGADVKKKIEQGQYILDEQVRKDSNRYIPKDTGQLEGSSTVVSEPGKGIISWNTPYAARLYYNPQYNFSKTTNPLAGGLWFERAKSAHAQEWAEIIKKLIK